MTEDKKKSQAGGVTDKTNKSAKLITDEISNVVLGKEQTIEMLMAGVLANGNILFEDYPGLAKTLRQFSTEKKTWTEKLFRGSARGLQRIFGMQTSK